MDYNIKSVKRVFEIIQEISCNPQTPAELASNLDINKSTIHRFLSTLQNLGYIEKMADNSVRLSQSFINIAMNAQTQYEIVNICRPYLVNLSEEFQEGALLATFNGKESEYVDKVESSLAVRIVFEPGKKAPAYSVASGKVFLASLKEEELNHYLEEMQVTQFTKNTITDEKKLRKELAGIRKSGYATDNEEYEIGLRGFACPIKDYKGNTVAAICIAGIAPRITDAGKINEIIRSLKEDAKEISMRMGYKAEDSKEKV
ncbi:IclR family transcriptional regulator [Halobacillus andaensis]|uniref:IclR family transcriptional regulator n=1 Tax=Halobacillus andaensis TaxID=1176239 RepID=UPI003D73A683